MSGEYEPTEHSGEFEIAKRPWPQEAQVLQARACGAQIEKTGLLHVAEPHRKLPG
jgi:hypothetical protein